MKNKALSYVLRFMLSCSLIAYFIAHTDMHSIGSTISRVAWGVVLLLCALQILSIIVNSWKWQILLPGNRFIVLLKLNLIGQFYSLVLPGQMTGAIVKSAIAVDDKNSVRKVAISVVADKATGFLALILIGCAGLFITSAPLPRNFRYFLILMILLCSATIIMCFSTNARRWINKPIKALSKFHRVFKRLSDFIDSLESYTSKQLIYALLLGGVYQIMCILIFAIMASSLNIDVNFFDWWWIFAVLSVALFLPVSIAGIGVRELSLVGMLRLIGIPPEQSIALSFSVFGVTLFLPIIGFFLEFFRKHSASGTPNENQQSEVNAES